MDVGEIGSLVSLRGIDRGNLFSIAALHPLVVDEEAGWLGVLPAIGSSKLNGKIGHLSRRVEGP